MRIRSIHPDALKSKKLRLASPEAERCYWRLQVACDDEGRCEDDPDVLADQLFLGNRSIMPDDLDRWLWELHELGLIVRYCHEDDWLLEVSQWSKYQHPQHAKPSAYGPHLPGTERIHDTSPDHGNSTLLSGVEWSGDELTREGEAPVIAFVNESPQDVVDRARREEDGTVWRDRCVTTMQVARAATR